MAKKSILDEAKDMFSSWKDEIEEKDGYILERKRLRDSEDKELHNEIKKQFYEVSLDVSAKAKKAFDISVKEFSEFSEAVKNGTATVYKKLEIEEHLKLLNDFLNNIQSKSSKKFKNISEVIKEKMTAYDKELNSEIEEVQDIKTEQQDTENIENLIKLAQKEYELKKK